jgi:8-oxo-dGTP pyrophosphatase MutT (NUDIX family)
VHEPSGAPVPPREAASLILLRDGVDGPEVLLLQRHPGSRFSPGAFAFPGGRVEPADAAPDVERWSRLAPVEAARRLPGVTPAARAVGFWIAALREAFEEVGVLLACDPEGRPMTPAALAAARARRGECRRDGAALGRILAALDLVLATDRLAYWAHWITPEERPIRYDTRFFLAPALTDQTPEPDDLEVVGWRWLAPHEALRQHRAGSLALPFPTQRILASLAGHADVEALLTAARAAEHAVRAIRPRVVRGACGERVLLPGDPGWY